VPRNLWFPRTLHFTKKSPFKARQITWLDVSVMLQNSGM
jgi:hypothetical protein